MSITKTRNCILIFFLLFVSRVSAQSYGLEFSSYEVVQEKRTSLVLNPEEDVCCKKQLDLSFDFSFRPNKPTYFGYIFRIVNGQKQNIDLVYNQRSNHFSVIWGETFTPIDFYISDTLLVNSWVKFGVKIEGTQFSLYRDGKLLGQTKVDLKDHCFKIVFGACNLYDFKTTDVSPFRLRNVRLHADAQKERYWPLNESTGNIATDSISGHKAQVNNANWILPMYERWQLQQSFHTTGNTSVAFDKAKEQLYITGKDTVYIFSMRDGSLQGNSLQGQKHSLIQGNQSVFNPVDNRLYNYFLDQQRITLYDPVSKKWAAPFDTANSTEYWHANRFINEAQNALYVVGGYGQLKYKNDIQRYDFGTHTWSHVTLKGDSLTPRYLAALATTHHGDTAYLLGGYGSTKGDQVLNPRYHYELLRFDVQKQEMKKLLSLTDPKDQFVFANSFVVDNNNDFYALIHPKDKFQSSLQLIKGNINSSSYVLAADSIPYTFQDTRSFADLYLCEQSKTLLAVTLYTDKDKNTEVNIYTIAFPPNVWPVATVAQSSTTFLRYGLIVLAVLIVIGIIYLIKKRNSAKSHIATQATIPTGEAEKTNPVVPAAQQTKQTTIIEERVVYMPEEQMEPEVPSAAKSAIMLFGNFEVIDSKGNNLTRLFTPLLKEMFLLITLYTIKSGHGISSEKLNEILWNDKSDKDAKNNRSVNMVKLKNILEQMGECVVVKDAGRWMLKYNPEQLHIDLVSLLGLAVKKQPYTKQEIFLLMAIVQRGAFLYQTDYAWLDDIKSDVSNKVIDALIEASNVLSEKKEPELLIETANCIFHFDQINEHALKIKCKSLIALGRHSLARNCYEKFTKDYSQMYGEDFGETFNEVIA